MNLNLNGKTAFVCGCTQGIGKATAIELASMGANIVLVARNEEKLEQVLDELPKSESQIHRYLLIDFDNTDTIKDKINQFIQKFPQANILINNTGGPAGGAIIESEIETFEKAFRSHVLTAQILSQALVPLMKDAPYGRIVNVTSIGMKQPIVGLGVSNTIRGAMGNWAKSMANELGKFGITTNNVLPGYTKTGRLEAVNQMRAKATNQPIEDVEKEIIKDIPIGRFTLPEETAAVIAFLCSPAAASVNGVSIPVDGGKTTCL